MAECIFCSIVKGDVPSTKVYEDEQTLAFLDINPLARGHTLVVPKTHAKLVQDLDVESASSFFETTFHLVDVVQQAVGAPASTVAVNNGPEAGQEVPHVHLHIVPRFDDDKAGPIHAMWEGKAKKVAKKDMEKIAETIRSAFDGDGAAGKGD